METVGGEEMKTRVGPSGKLACLWNVKTIEAVLVGQYPNLFYDWGKMSVQLLPQKGSMFNPLKRYLKILFSN